jgi:nicotinamide mononucleotide (NMN) deamidase PncC
MTTDSVAAALVDLLHARGLTCATAESCTGGGVGSAITAIPGSSAVFAGGVVSYSNDVKRDVLFRLSATQPPRRGRQVRASPETLGVKA